MHLLNARRPNGVRVLDFRNLRTLSVVADKERDLVAIRAFIRVTERLETLIYDGTYQDSAMAYHTSLTILAGFTQGYAGFAASMNASSLSTLRTLHLQHDIEDDIQDPLCGICEEFSIISGRNVIEEISWKSPFKPTVGVKPEVNGEDWMLYSRVVSPSFATFHSTSKSVFFHRPSRKATPSWNR